VAAVVEREFVVLGRALKSWLSSRRRVKSRLRVLIVDDEAAVCSFVARVLQRDGHTTEIAHNPLEALDKFVTLGPFDLLLTDENMVEASGHELAAQVRRLDPDIRVLYVTGYSDMLFNGRSTLWEGEAYVEKPVSARGLSEAIALLLRGRTGEDQSHHSDR
jgi:CheY-like chemotaxis protein